MTRPNTHTPLLRLLVVTLLGPLLLAFGAGASAAAAAEQAPGTGWIRFAHLSPDTPEVDVRLTSFAGAETLRLEDVGYGVLSDFERVPVGSYNASMVPAGSPEGTAPVLSATLRVEEGQAYTAVAVGLQDDLSVTVLEDDLTPPPAGQARVRLVQAANGAPVVDVTAQNGPVLAEDARFGTATGYAVVPAGSWTVEVTPVEGDVQATTADLQLEAGSVHTVLVLDDPAGGLTVRTAIDSESMPTMPERGVDTGAGGAYSGRSGGATVPPIGAAFGAAALLGVGVLAARNGQIKRGAKHSAPTR